jgi:hypothetical protein
MYTNVAQITSQKREISMDHRRPYPYRTILLLGLMPLLVGCSSSHTGSTAQATTTSQATATPQPISRPPNCPPVAPGVFPFGDYVNPGGFGPEVHIEFLPNGEATGEEDARVDCYTITGQHILFFGTVPCQDTAAEYGDYIWLFEGDVLRFTLVQEHCAERASALTGIDWTRQAIG